MLQKLLGICLFCLAACACVQAQSVAIPAGPDRFAGITPAMPTSAQMVHADNSAADAQRSAAIARLSQMTPLMPRPDQIVTEVPPALRKASFQGPRQADAREMVTQDPPMRAVQDTVRR